MNVPPTDDELRLVAQHGSGELERSLAVVQLAKRRGQLDELEEFVDTEALQ